MEIKNIKINNYGTLKQKEINLENNINIIYGKNESGKSTLLNYLKNIFYGISKNKNGKEISDYEKYLPWVGEDFSGKIKYQLNNGNTFEIFRDFNKKNPIIFNQDLRDVSSDFKIDKKDGNQYFYEQTGIDEKTYISTIMSLQQEVVLNNQNQNILIQKLSNIMGTGEDKVSFQKAMERLNKKLVEEVGTSRTQDRPINIIQNRMEKVSSDLKTKKEVQKNKEMLQEKKDNLMEKLKNKIEEKNNLIKNSTKNIKLNSEKNNLIKNRKINYLIFGIIFILLFILNLFNFNLIKNKTINYLILFLIPVEIITFIFYLIKNKRIKNEENIEKEKINKELKEKITILNSEINLLEEDTKKLEKEIKQEKEDIIFKFNLDKQDISKELEININIEEKDKIEKELEYSNKKIVEYKLELNGLKYEENEVNDKLEDSISKEEEYENLQEQLDELEEKNKYILATKELLEKAYEKMKNNVTPKFTQNLSNIASNISNGKYKKVIFDEEKGLVVELETGEYISANRLSIGTIDELYLSLRLSMLDEISSEKMPIILDEAFAYFDDERLKNCLIFLAEQSEKHQIIILTCSNRERQILDSVNIKYNLVEL